MSSFVENYIANNECSPLMFPIQLLIAEKRSPNEKVKASDRKRCNGFPSFFRHSLHYVAAVFHVNSTDGSFDSKSLTQKDVTT